MDIMPTLNPRLRLLNQSVTESGDYPAHTPIVGPSVFIVAIAFV